MSHQSSVKHDTPADAVGAHSYRVNRGRHGRPCPCCNPLPTPKEAQRVQRQMEDELLDDQEA